MIDTKLEYQRNFVIEQLEKYNYRDVEGKTYKELVNKLARLRALEIKVESPNNSWF